MPELPEVETVCRGIKPHTESQTVKDIIIRNKNMRWPIPASIKIGAINQVIRQVVRRAKYILLITDNGTIIIHLGMSGVLKVVDAKTPLLKHDHVDIMLGNSVRLRLNDPRRFGCVLWTQDSPYSHKLLKNLAPEPLGLKFNANYLYKKIQTRKAPIKNVIMDSKTVVGVGNIYASESLFLSRINPKLAANKLSKEQVKTLVANIKKILRASIKAGGTTLKDFTQADGKPGYFAQNLLVYGQKGKPCVLCQTPIEYVVIGQRATYFCPKCQKMK